MKRKATLMNERDSIVLEAKPHLAIKTRPKTGRY